jgi:hypothetical protein
MRLAEIVKTVKRRRSRMRMMRTNDYGKGILTLSIITPSIATLETQKYPDGRVLFGSSVPVSGSG